MRQFYRKLIEPRSYEPEARNRELVLNYVLLGLIILVAAEFSDSFFGFALLGQHYIVFRLLALGVVLVFFCGLYWFAHQKYQQRLASFVIVLTLLGLAALVISAWGTLTPTGILLFGLIIVMAGILLGARYALYAALASTFMLIIFEYLKAHAILSPNLTWMQRPSSLSDVLGFAIIYAIIALVSWLYNRQMERSLELARQSEVALERHNERLEETVKKRTEQLEIAQLEKLQQIYRFAELGRISSALFHDLANHLTTVSLEIEGLGSGPKSELMERIQNDIGYIDEVVQRVRLQLRGRGLVERFNVIREINKVVNILNYKMVQSHIEFSFQKPRQTIHYTGDLIPFRQIISNLLSNAIDACGNVRARQAKINLTITTDQTHIIIAVTDWGVGIKPSNFETIFEPFYSNKSDGTGIGLFIVKQVVVEDLRGTITVTSNTQTGTTFTVKIPYSDAKH